MNVTLSAPYCPSCGYPFDDPKRIIQPQGHSVNPCCETCGREEAPAKATGIMSEFFKAKCSGCGAALDKSGPLCEGCLTFAENLAICAAGGDPVPLLDELRKNLEIIQQALLGAQAEKEAAVLAERERCACLVLKYGPLSLRELAEKIMEGK